jgi:hypothetical protein
MSMTTTTNQERDEAMSTPIDTTLWCVNITGPDDVIAVASRAEAIDLAARFNQWWMTHFPAATLHPYEPTTWAVPIPYPNSPEGHAEALGNLGEYEWLLSTPPVALPPTNQEHGEG